ncbi:MAG TPA: GntR family transcriptional regulator [Sphingobium sp.]|nr:GntR family transcriptional regulator [Sphingobium sp.]
MTEKMSSLKDKPAQSVEDGVAALEGAGERQSATLTQSVYAQLRADILNGRMRPGEKIRAEAVRRRFNTASSPVREALNRLLSEGFVALEQQKGFRVAPVSAEELKELVKTRCWIDGLAIRESIERFDLAWEENLILALHHLSRTHRGESGQAETSEWESRHKDFHMALIDGCGSRWITRISGQLFDAAERYRLLALEQVLERNELQEHRDLVDACINRDADRAIVLLAHHYNQTFEAIVTTSLNI